MKTKLQFLLLTIGSLLVGACGSDPALEGVKMKMKAVTTQSSINGRVNATGLTFTDIMIGVDEIEFETDLEDDQEDNLGEDDELKVEFEGPYVIDLVNGTSTPNLGIGDVPTGVYDELEIELAPVLPLGNTVFIKFTYNGKTYEFSTTEEIEIEVEDLSGYTIDANSLQNMLVLINLDAVFAGIDLSSAEADEDGVVRINDSSNSDIAQDIIDQLEDSCDAGEDDDRDGDID